MVFLRISLLSELNSRYNLEEMIFLIDILSDAGRMEVAVYDSLQDLSRRVEWQDILDSSLRILDTEGCLYVWDDSRKEEIGTVSDYSFKTNGMDMELARRCNAAFVQLNQPDYFELESTE